MMYAKLILALFLGALLWTFMEYMLHRFLGHVKKRLLVRTRFHKEHTKHHLKRDYFAGALDKFLTLIAIGPVIFLISYLLTETLTALVFTASFTTMYLTYELIHRRMHVKSPPHIYASKMRAHHFYHHFVDETMNHGVTTPIWDMVFGTYRKPSTISLKRKFLLPWIKVDDKGEFQDRWGQKYQVKA
jgi:sterol desaturase/sphingolipid hydroxylase (fatty acid hydroxylase superfamily)